MLELRTKHALPSGSSRMSDDASPTPSPLLALVGEAGVASQLTENERACLERPSPELRQLTPKAQWAWIASNRKVGYWVTLLAGGVRLVALAGGSFAGMSFAGRDVLTTWQRDATIDWGLAALGCLCAVLFVWTLTLFRGLRVKLTELSRPLPPFESIKRS